MNACVCPTKPFSDTQRELKGSQGPELKGNNRKTEAELKGSQAADRIKSICFPHVEGIAICDAE